MECRCYTGAGKRTRMKKMQFALRDYLMLVFIIILTASVIYLSYFAQSTLFIFEKVI